MIELSQQQKEIFEIIVAKAVEQDGKLIISNAWGTVKKGLIDKGTKVNDNSITWTIQRLVKHSFLIRIEKGIYEVRKDLPQEIRCAPRIGRKVITPKNEKEKQERTLLEQGYRVMQVRLENLQAERTDLEKRIETTREAVKIMALLLKIW